MEITIEIEDWMKPLLEFWCKQFDCTIREITKSGLTDGIMADLTSDFSQFYISGSSYVDIPKELQPVAKKFMDTYG